MKFKISEISRLSGFSTSGIRFYEQAGVISPIRGENKKYRNFTLNDLQLIMVCRFYRECGFTLHESAELLNHADPQKVKAQLESRCVSINQEIIEKQFLCEFLTQKARDIECTRSKEPGCQLVQYPALLRTKVWQPGSGEAVIHPSPIDEEWLNYAPFVESCLLLSEEDLLYGEGELATNWGLVIEERYANYLKFSPKSKVEYIPSCQCVQTTVKVSENLSIFSDQLQEVRQFIFDHNLVINGTPISSLLCITNHNGQLTRYDYLRIPIRSTI